MMKVRLKMIWKMMDNFQDLYLLKREMKMILDRKMMMMKKRMSKKRIKRKYIKLLR
jgi:hypothetical protein